MYVLGCPHMKVDAWRLFFFFFGDYLKGTEAHCLLLCFVTLCPLPARTFLSIAWKYIGRLVP